MKLPVVIHKDQNSDYGVTIPDLPGCFSAGSTIDEAFSNAVEASECHIEGLLLDEEEIPSPRQIEDHIDDPQFSGGIWGIIEVDLSKISGKTRRVNITLPERLLTQIDNYVSKAGETRSGFLAHAALEYVATHPLTKP
jgi:predicted RNase H-like HicB family nuclease